MFRELQLWKSVVFLKSNVNFLSCEVGSSNSLTWHPFFDLIEMHGPLFRNRPFLQWVCGFGGGAPMGSVREPQKVRVDVLDRAKNSPHSRDANPPVKTWHFLRGSQVKPSLEMSNRNPLNIGIAYNILKVQNLLRILHLLVFEAIFQKMSQLDVICWTIYFLKIHPRNLTWNLKISQFVEKESPFKETIIFRFQPLNFGGCTVFLMVFFSLNSKHRESSRCPF